MIEPSPKVDYTAPGYRGKRVRKAWGWERLLWAHDDVALWHLRIANGQRTSMHLHHRKKTGLVVLGGQARVGFLSGGVHDLGPGEGTMIRAGVYHQTTALSDLDLLEVETPNDKGDLLRLEDDYGRAGKPYEETEALEDDPDEKPVRGSWWSLRLGSCWVGYGRATAADLTETLAAGSVIFLSGGVDRPFNGTSAPIFGPGDVAAADTVRRLAARYRPQPSTIVRVIP